jgi:hypothetical protein
MSPLETGFLFEWDEIKDVFSILPDSLLKVDGDTVRAGFTEDSRSAWLGYESEFEMMKARASSSSIFMLIGVTRLDIRHGFTAGVM